MTQAYTVVHKLSNRVIIRFHQLESISLWLRKWSEREGAVVYVSMLNLDVASHGIYEGEAMRGGETIK